MSGPDAATRLCRLLDRSAAGAGVTLAVSTITSRRWASATFTGARHLLTLSGQADDATERWLDDLPEAELTIPGHLVADLKIVAMHQAADRLRVELEILTVEDG